jgi:23S rRNA (adenine2503-C2)-methyltransferase
MLSKFTKREKFMQTNYRDRIYLLDLSWEELVAFVAEAAIDNYRSKQIFKGVYHHLLPDFSSLSTLSKPLRKKLDEMTVLRQLTLKDRRISRLDDTSKFLWTLSDNKLIESVVIYEGKRTTYCVSTQVGCALGCRFCATGEMGFLRNLRSGEIVEQVIQMKQISESTPTNIVFMGMGEPLLNTRNVLKAAHIISHPEGLAVARKRLTFSTSGIVPAIRKLADSPFPFALAVSLNAADDRTRNMLMPVNVKFPLNQLLQSLIYFYSKHKSRITFEYVLISGVNDHEEDAVNLVNICKKIPSKINLIPCNSQNRQYQPPATDHINWFASFLRNQHCTVTLRLRKGYDIEAACGQLYTKHVTLQPRKT